MRVWLAQNIVNIVLGLISILAMFISPVVALRLQKKIETDDDQKERKRDIFKVLMATRAARVSFEHVKALNMIDVEFYHDKEITDSWHIYRDHLNSYPQTSSETDEKLWSEKTAEYLTDLLFVMSKLLGYSFDKVLLRKGAYIPVAHADLDFELAVIRRGFVQLLSGEKPINVQLTANSLVAQHKQEKSIIIAEPEHELSD